VGPLGAHQPFLLRTVLRSGPVRPSPVQSECDAPTAAPDPVVFLDELREVGPSGGPERSDGGAR
jgi:hypothetical protein